MDRRGFLLGSLGSLAALPALAGPLHPGRLLIPLGSFSGVFGDAAAHWDFTQGSLIDKRGGLALTFTRASDGTYFDSAGILQTATTNQPRFDHDPATGQSLGLLIEEARTNESLRSETIDTGWNFRGTAAATVNDAVAPDGNTTAEKIEGLGAAGANDVFQVLGGGTFTNDAVISPSVWVKKITATGTLDIINTQGAGLGRWTVDFSALGSEWERITATHAAATVVAAFVASASGGGGFQFASSAGAPLSLHLWGAQQEEGAFPTSYIPTTTAAVTRAQDRATIPSVAWWDTTNSTFYISYTPANNGQNLPQRVYLLGGLDSGLNRFTLRGGDTGGSNYPELATGDGASVASLNPVATQTVNVLNKVAFTHTATGKQMSLNGATVISNGTGFVNVGISDFEVGNNQAGANPMSLHISEIANWSPGKPDSFLPEITT